jgi:hypothetical protein
VDEVTTEFFLYLCIVSGFQREREGAKNFVAMAAVVMSYYCKPSPFLGHFPSYLVSLLLLVILTFLS